MDKDKVKLIEKIGRAKLLLEQGREDHMANCNVIIYPDGMAPCNCGASKHNALLDKVIRELSIDK